MRHLNLKRVPFERYRQGLLSGLLALGALTLNASPAAAQTFVCDGKFYLAQNNPSNYFVVNTATNQLDAALNPGVYTNAIGYNRVDDFIYGIHSGNGNIYRVKANGTFDFLGTVTDGNGAILRSYAGDVAPNGEYYILNTSQTTAEGARRRVLYRIQVTGLGTANLLGHTVLSETVSVADLAFNPVDGNLYGVQGSRVVQVNPTTGQVVRLTTTATPSIGSAGATYFDAFGNFYAYNNGTGNIIRYVISGTTATGTLYATGPRVSLNDGASCPYQPQLGKDVSPSPINAGQNVTYTYQLANPNPNAAVNDVDFTDVLPATDGRTFIAGTVSIPGGTVFASQNISADGKTFTINDIDLPPNSITTITIQATVPLDTPAGTVDNQASLTLTSGVVIESDYPPSGTPQDETPLEILPPFADLSMSKSVDNALATNGDRVTYTISLTNTGPGDATGLVVSEPLAAGLNYVSDIPSQGTYDNNTGLWTVGTVANGDTATLQITVDITTANPTTNTSQVVASDQPDPDSTPNNNDPTEDDQASVTVPDAAADLNVTKTRITGTPINLGDNVTFRVSVRNDGPSNGTGVTITDQLPPGLTFVGPPVFSDGTDTYDPATGLWTLGNVNVGQTDTLDITATVNTANALNNIALVSGLDQTDPDPTDNQDNATVPAQQADLQINKVVNNNTPDFGENVTFTLTATNPTGPNNATGVEVTDQLPVGLTLVSATPTDGTDIYNTTTGVWTIGNLDVGDTAGLDIVATVNSTDTLTNTATITGSDQTDPVAGNNSSSDTVDGQQIDLEIKKTLTPANVTNGNPLTYTVVVTNNGPNQATGVVVQDQLPAGLTGITTVTTTPPGTAPANPPAGAPFNWNVGTLANGAQATLTINATLNSGTPITNVAEIFSADQPDSDSTPNNGDLAEDDQDSVVTLAQQADLTISKEVIAPTQLDPSDALVNIGEDVTFRITLVNDPTGVTAPAIAVDATNVQVTEQLPAGLTFVSSTASQGNYNPTSGIWNIGTVPLNQSVTLDIVTVVSSVPTVTNVATVSDVDQEDPDLTDNQNGADVTGLRADLEVTKVIDNPAAGLGDPIQYTVTIQNNGPSTATGVQVLEQIPAGLGNVVPTASAGTTYNAGTGIWAVGTLTAAGAGSTATLEIAATIDAFAQITNVAQVIASDQPDPDSDPDDDDPDEDDYGTVSVGQNSDPMLQIVKRIMSVTGVNGTTNFTNFENDSTQADQINLAGLPPLGATQVTGNPPSQSGDIVEYVIYFLSNGNVPASPATVCDMIPANTTFLPNAYGPNQGIQVQIAGATAPTAMTNTSGDDIGTFYSPLAPLPANNPCTNQANPDGAIVVDFGSVPNTAGGNTGFIKFQVMLN